jgi:hypothetical protein
MFHLEYHLIRHHLKSVLSFKFEDLQIHALLPLELLFFLIMLQILMELVLAQELEV